MTRRTDHIRATALRLARSHKLTTNALADAVHIELRQARHWIKIFHDEGLIHHTNEYQQTPTTGPPRKLWIRAAD